MRLLHLDDDGSVTLTKNLQYGHDKYAILSHTWGGDEEEVTFDDIQNLSIEDKKEATLAKKGYSKILFCAEQAKRCGIDYFWVDTCCIDKSSSAELQEAINSMFSWYKDAKQCFVYLSDVPHESWTDSLPLSRWFTRGWTLQELIAPENVDFYTEEGLHLGSKLDLESDIVKITGIPAPALRSQDPTDFTVQERLAWAEHRHTKRPEDKSYCLLGIFDVYIPMIYGEGEHSARQRLRRAVSESLKGPDHEDYSLAFDIDSAEVDHFVGRRFELTQIHSCFRQNLGRQTAIIHGLGGMGKTQLAIAYAKQYRDSYSAIHWFNAHDEAMLKQSFMRMARRLQAKRPPSRNREGKGQTIENAIEDILKWLSEPQNTRWLMIFDNFDTPRQPGNTCASSSDVDLAKYLPEAQQGCVIITSRSPYIKFGRYIHLNKMSQEEEALEILSSTSARADISQDPDATAIVRRLDGLPLALATAGAYLCETAISCANYLRLYEERWLKLLEMSPELNSYEDRMLYSTWNITFSSIEQRNKLSANLVRFWAYLNKDDVWFELLKQDIPNSPDWFRQLGDELCFTQAMRVLSQFRLVEPNSWIAEPIETGGYSMHSCVHSWTVNVLNAERDNALAKLAVQCIASHVPRRGEPFWWITQGRLRLHAAQYPCDTIDKLSATDNLEYAMFRLANLALDQDNLEAAEPLLERTLKLQQTSRGLDDLATLSTMNVMGALRRRQTRFDEAHDSYTRVLGSAGSTTDEAVACRLDAMYNLGCLHLYKDQPDEAERFFQQAQSAYEKAEGYEDKLFELDLLDYMGIVHRKLARLDKAVKLHRKAVEGKTELLGRGHMSTLDSTVNLALALFWQQELGEAGKLLWNVCMGRVQALGSRHILTMDAFSLWDNVQFLSSNPKEAEKIPGMLERGASGGVGSSGGEPDMCHVNFAAFFRFICRQRPGLRWHSLYKDPEL